MKHPCTFVLFLLVAGGVTAQSPSASAAPSGPARDHRLFVGVNVRLPYRDNYTLVADFDNKHAILSLPDATRVSVSRVDSYRFDLLPKLSRVTIMLEDVTTDRTTAHGKSRRESIRRQMALMGEYQDRVNVQMGGMTRMATTGQIGGDGPLETPDEGELDRLNEFEQSMGNLDKLMSGGTAVYDYSYFADAGENSGNKALRVRARISAPVTVTDAYVVGLVRIRTDDHGYNDILFLRDIPRIGPTPLNLEMTRSGLPEKFEVISVDLHLFREGHELATNLSEKQLPLTKEEALQYLAVDRMAQHRGETLPPAPAWELAPDALLAAVNPDAFDYAITAQIDATGRLVTFDAPAITPEHIRSIVSDLAFVPALDQGTEAAGTVSFNLRDFFH